MANILIIDDDPDIRAFLSMVVEDAGHVVTEAECTSTVFTLLDTSAYPYIVLVRNTLDSKKPATLLLAGANYGRLARHTYVVLTTSAGCNSPLLTPLLATRDLPVVLLPFGIPALPQLIADLSSNTPVAY